MQPGPPFSIDTSRCRSEGTHLPSVVPTPFLMPVFFQTVTPPPFPARFYTLTFYNPSLCTPRIPPTGLFFPQNFGHKVPSSPSRDKATTSSTRQLTIRYPFPLNIFMTLGTTGTILPTPFHFRPTFSFSLVAFLVK